MIRVQTSLDTYERSADPLVVHGLSQDPSVQLVLFVHGLNGHRYKTWGSFPGLLSAAMACDVGLYGYASGLKRVRRLSAAFDKQAEELAHQLRDSPYERVVLIGHSMGGLLCMAAVRNLIDGLARDTVDRIAALFLVGTPQAGSRRVPFFSRYLSPDLKVLHAHSATLTDIQRRFTDHVVPTALKQTYGSQSVIPTYAVMGTADKWVDDLSAGLGIPSSQTKRVSGSHTDIAKPSETQKLAFEFTRDRAMEACAFHLERSSALQRVRDRMLSVVSSQFEGVDLLMASSMIGGDS